MGLAYYPALSTSLLRGLPISLLPACTTYIQASCRPPQHVLDDLSTHRENSVGVVGSAHTLYKHREGGGSLTSRRIHY